MATTHSGEFKFTVKEYAGGIPWIALEPMRQSIPQLENVLLGFELPERTSFAQADEIARYLNTNLEKLTLTELHDKESDS